MDAILVLAPTRWKLRQAVKVVNQVLASLRLAKHPDKTFIGQIAKGFDWLGYHLSPDGLRVAKKTLENVVTRIRRLYEQSQEEPLGSSWFGDYVRRWVRWLKAGLTWDVRGRHPRSAHSHGSAWLPIVLRAVVGELDLQY
jgi:RNA-directed DNA polymerase